jgi:hypothetical protein
LPAPDIVNTAVLAVTVILVIVLELNALPPPVTEIADEPSVRVRVPVPDGMNWGVVTE